MRTTGDAPSKVRKITIEGNQSALEIYCNPSQLEPIASRAAVASVADGRAGVSRKKQQSKKRKVMVPAIEDVVALSPLDETTHKIATAPRDGWKRPWTTCIRCAPALVVVATIGELTIEQGNEVKRMGFDGLLKFNLKDLERRDMLCFLMDKIDPVEMVISTSGERSIPITPHAVKCVFGIPCDGNDALMVTQVARTSELAELKRLLEVQQNSNIKASTLIARIKTGGTDALRMRCFFLIVFSKLLFPTININITGKDVVMTKEMDKLADVN